MRLDHLAEAGLDRLLGRIIRQALIALVLGVICALAAIVALYHFSIAGLLALQVSYGFLSARLIVGAIYAAVSVIALLALWLQKRQKRQTQKTGLLGGGKAPATPRELQFVMLAEAAMLGYQLARKVGQARS